MSIFVDPICGMSVSPETAAGNFEKEGEVFFFCSLTCLNTFERQIEAEKIGNPTIGISSQLPIRIKMEAKEKTETNPIASIVQVSRKKPQASDFVTHVDPVCKMLVKSETAAAAFEAQPEQQRLQQ